MKIENNEQQAHSANYFGEYRDYWWNQDFLQLMSKRLNLDRIESVLDVGCGVGHWGQLLANILPSQVNLIGVDREPLWVQKAIQRARQFGLNERFSYQEGDINKLNFSDNTFDLVTCQTVLIHMKNPQEALKEMLRVLKPGGLIFLAEPHNFSSWSLGSSLSENMEIDEALKRLKFALMLEKGKKAMGLGDNSIGGLIPGFLAELKTQNIQVYLSDKTNGLKPPYFTPEEKVLIKQLRDWQKRKFVVGDRQEIEEYFMAAGGNKEEFDYFHNLLLVDLDNEVKAIERNEFHIGGGAVMYLIAAEKALE